MSDFNSALQNIMQCMHGAGDIKFGETCIKDASLDLLQPNEDTIVDHWKVFQGATAYYTFLLNQAISALESAELTLKQELLRQQAELVGLAKDKYLVSRPSKEDLIVISVLEGKEDLKQLQDDVIYWKNAVRNLESWVSSWEKKSFCLNGISQASSPNLSVIKSPRTPE
jgi:hypothetical protein